MVQLDDIFSLYLIFDERPMSASFMIVTLIYMCTNITVTLYILKSVSCCTTLHKGGWKIQLLGNYLHLVTNRGTTLIHVREIHQFKCFI